MNKQAFVIGAVFATAAFSVFAQGSLTPPGSPAPTMKTLEQVEPRIDLATVGGDASSEIAIYNSGSYYLSEDLEVSTYWGIFVAAEDVTLDLNGFKISRTSGSGGYGIYLDSFANRVTVRNGSIAGFDEGIWGYTESCLFEKLAVSGCAVNGIFSGPATRIIDCRAHNNPGAGISAGRDSILSGCMAYNNTGKGFYVFSGGLSGCTAKNNQGSHGIHVYEKAVMENCSADGNDGIGIEVGNGSTLIGCIASNNEGSFGLLAGDGASLSGCGAYTNDCAAAIKVGTGSSLENCTANYNRTSAVSASYAISAGAGSTLRGCTANGNIGTTALSCGISASMGSTVTGCAAFENSNTNTTGSLAQGVGIYVWYSGIVKDCTASHNQGAGIRMVRYCSASGNTAYGNGWGIHAVLDGNRIDGNHAVSNSLYGIILEGSGNIAVRNTTRGNGTGYFIAAGNDVGTIQTSPVGAGPWDNFEF